MIDTKTVMIVTLALVAAILGYLYYDLQQRKVTINLPGIKIEAK